MDHDYGEEFKNSIIPHAIDWFTGKALQFENYESTDVNNIFYYILV